MTIHFLCSLAAKPNRPTGIRENDTDSLPAEGGEGFPQRDSHGPWFETSRPDLLARISRLEMEHDELTERILTLPPDLKRVHQKAQRRLAELEAELDRSERQLENASEAMEKNQILLAEATRAHGSAKESLASETEMSACREQAAVFAPSYNPWGSSL